MFLNFYPWIDENRFRFRSPAWECNLIDKLNLRHCNKNRYTLTLNTLHFWSKDAWMIIPTARQNQTRPKYGLTQSFLSLTPGGYNFLFFLITHKLQPFSK